jgi:hypothetical protein
MTAVDEPQKHRLDPQTWHDGATTFVPNARNLLPRTNRLRVEPVQHSSTGSVSNQYSLRHRVVRPTNTMVNKGLFSPCAEPSVQFFLREQVDTGRLSI